MGQGANQALEDVRTLIDLLLDHLPPSKTSTNISEVQAVFSSLTEKRIPRTSTLVAKAREVGRLRVLPSSTSSVEAQERNARIQKEWTQDDKILLKMYEELLGLPLLS